MSEDLNRQLGVEANNETWRVLDAGGPGSDASEAERSRFLYRAYASAYHWMETPAGTVANRARGEHLIARAAIAVGLPDVALRHARSCLDLCVSNAESMEDWDLAFAEEAVARALAAGGDHDGAREHRARAASAGAAIAEEDDREVFLEVLSAGPWFGID